MAAAAPPGRPSAGPPPPNPVPLFASTALSLQNPRTGAAAVFCCGGVSLSPAEITVTASEVTFEPLSAAKRFPPLKIPVKQISEVHGNSSEASLVYRDGKIDVVSAQTGPARGGPAALEKFVQAVEQARKQSAAPPAVANGAANGVVNGFPTSKPPVDTTSQASCKELLDEIEELVGVYHGIDDDRAKAVQRWTAAKNSADSAQEGAEDQLGQVSILCRRGGGRRYVSLSYFYRKNFRGLCFTVYTKNTYRVVRSSR